MRTLFFTVFAVQLIFLSCIGSRNLPKLNEVKDLYGDWEVSAVELSGERILASELGGKVRFSFREDGSAEYSTPNGGTRSGIYEVRDGKIFDPEHPLEKPVDIISLNKTELKLAMEEGGERMVMTFISR